MAIEKQQSVACFLYRLSYCLLSLIEQNYTRLLAFLSTVKMFGLLQQMIGL